MTGSNLRVDQQQTLPVSSGLSSTEEKTLDDYHPATTVSEATYSPNIAIILL